MPRSLRIAFVSMHTSPADVPGSGDAGGMNVVEQASATALVDRGHHVELITRRSDPRQPDAVEIGPGLTLRHVPAGPPERLAKSLIDAHIDEFRDGLATLGPYDILHSHHWMSGVAALPLARTWGIPHIQSFHSVAAHPGSDLAEGEPPESPARIPGEALVAQGSDAVVAISAAEARTVIDRCGAAPEHVCIVSPGVNRAIFHPGFPAGAGPTATGDRSYLLFAARLQPLKGPGLAIAALGEVPAAIRPHLVVAGDTSADFAAYRQELDDLVVERGLGDDVTFVGPQSRTELADLMRGAQIVLVPSHSETFGLIALEAAATGTPVIASAAGGLREAVVHGETGQLMDSREPADWGRAITTLLTDPVLRHRQGVVAEVHARRFDWDWTAAHLEAVYVDLLGGRNP